MGKRKKKRNQTTITRKLLYLASHIACGIAVILMFLTLIQCTIKKPEAPTWDTNLVVPLVHKTYDMPELIEKIDQENLSTDSLGNPFFFYSQVLDTVMISGSFAVEDISQNISESLGVVQLDPFTGAAVGVNLEDYVPFALGTVPPISFDISEPLPAMGEYTTAAVESGFALVTVVNDFGLNLDTVTVTIDDIIVGGQLCYYDIPGGIPAGESRVDTIDLSGRTVSNQFTISLHCYTPGATSFSLADKSMSATVSMPVGPTVSSATAQIPRITKQFNEDVAITSEHQLQAATLDNGQLVLDIENNTNVPATLIITLPDINDGASPLVINQPILPNNTHQVIYDLTGYNLEPSDQVMPQSMTVDIEAIIDSSGSQLITFNAGDRISVSTGIHNVSLASVQGILAPTTADFVDIEQAIEIPKGFDQVQLTSAVLMLEVENTVNIPGTFSVNIDGELGQHATINGIIAPGTPEFPTTSVIIDSNVVAFLNPVPELLTVNGNATFGDGVTSGSVNASDYITATVILSSPLEMIVGETTFDGEWESVDVDQTDITKLTDNLNLARVFMTIANRLPLGIEAEFYLSGDSATLYSNPEVVLGPITVAHGTLGTDGTVTSTVVSENVLSLSSEEARVLENEQLWIGQIFSLESTNGETVRFTASDSLTVSGYIEIDFTVSEALWED